jgi:3-methylcrotonyl-CoA carboxylase alpha subunit
MKTLLIANRGEIAGRIIRTARRMGIATVAVYSDADAKALHVRQADRAVRLGPGPATESYLKIDAVIEAAKAAGADAIHPGYGFLSENADFADAVVKAGLIFVGPTGDGMRKLGGKASAKDVAIAAGVPVVPGYQGGAQDLKTLTREAASIGYPVMIKAVAGGGGRGMRLVPEPDQLEPLLDSAKREAAAAFGNDHVLLEKVVVSPRHIEVQVFGDTHGNVVHLFERDCSLQRRNQKVIEEAPAPGMSAALRERITAAAVKLAKAVGYRGAGTVEFLVEGGTLEPHAPWYFIEMNTRLQVEHPVTEQITGLDLVEWQIRVARGEQLPLAQDRIGMCGHAIEVRLCAEDPVNGFMPSIGRISHLALPVHDGIRHEFGVESGSVISPFYDSMVGKIIATAADRTDAIAKLDAALGRFVLFGLKTNAPFLTALLRNPTVKAGTADTGLIGRELTGLTASKRTAKTVAAGLSALLGRAPPARSQSSPWDRTDAFQLGPARRLTYRPLIDGEAMDVAVGWDADGRLVTEHDGPATHPEFSPACVAERADDGSVHVLENGVHTTVAWPVYSLDEADAGQANAVRAPISGKLAKVFVAVGDTVEKGSRLAVVEAMKMEHVLSAPRAGRVERIGAIEGAQVAQAAVLITLAEDAT